MKMPNRLTLQPLSREGRDTVWLLAVLTVCVLPHLPRLPTWCAAGTLLAMAWRAHLAWRDAALPPRWVLMLALLGCLGLTFTSHQTLLGREAGITLVTVLAALKTLELKARRDAFVVTSLGFFLVLTQFLHSQAMATAALMLLAVLGLLSSLVLAQRPVGRPSLGSALLAASRCLVMGVPVMLALYLVFPRMGPLWSLPQDAQRRTGLSDRIELGGLADLAQDDSVAMRLRFEGPPPPPASLYFRGPVLEHFDGRTWRSLPPEARATAPDAALLLPEATPRLRYRMTLEATRMRDVPLLEGTLIARPAPPLTQPVLQRQGLRWQVASPLMERSLIDAEALPGTREGPQALSELALRERAQLPPGHNPRTLAWAAQLRQRADLREASARQLAMAVLRHISTGGYRYTLTPADTAPPGRSGPSAHAIDRFWLDGRAGFCEHFATAFVVIMRAMDVPARVVTGFQGAELNTVDGQHVVRNSDAHAWAEFWEDGVGWMRVDPTAAVAPERIERARPTFRNPDSLPATLGQLNPALVGRLREHIDAMNHRWNVWVLQYSRQQQQSLLQRWGLPARDTVDLLRLCALALASAALVGLAWLWWTRPRQRAHPWQVAMQQVHQSLVRAGWQPPPDVPAPAPAASWVRALSKHARDPDAHALVAALQDLDALRYAAQPDTPEGLPRRRKALVQAVAKLARKRTQRAKH